MKPLMATAEVVRLALRNIKRWRGRYATLAVLIATSCTIFTLYGGLLIANGTRSLGKIEKLHLPADYVVIASGARLNRSSDDRYQPIRAIKESMKYGEEAALLSVDTAKGKTKVLGVSPQTRFFSADVIKLSSGEFLKNEGDIVLPQLWMEERGLKLGSPFWLAILYPTTGNEIRVQFRVTGFFDRVDDLTLPLIRMEDAIALRGGAGANCYLVQKAEAVDHQQTLGYVSLLFPRDLVLSSTTPQQMGQDLITQKHSSGWGLLLLFEGFVGVAVLTIAMMTLLERRRELAVLKTLGAGNSQVALMLGAELLISAGAGVLMGGLATRVAAPRMPWMGEITTSTVFAVELGGSALSVAVMVLAALLPILMAKVATVNELLFARAFPLRRQIVNQVERAYPWVVERERQEGVRLLRLDLVDGRFYGILMKATGDLVKRGEVIASVETVFGFARKQWVSPVDGTVTDYNPVSGYMAIKPDHQVDTIGLQIQTFRAGPAVGLGGPCLAPRMATAEKPIQENRVVLEVNVPRSPKTGRRRRVVVAMVLCALAAPTAYLVLPNYHPQGLPITSYRPPTPLYPSYQQWSKELAELADRYPGLVQLQEIGKTYGGRQIFGLTLTDRTSGDERKKPGAFMMAGQHANEAISWQVGMNAIKQLLVDFGKDEAATTLLRQKVIYAVPMVNPDGYEIFTSVTTTAHGNARPIVDSDRDGRFDEDSIIMPPGAFLRTHVALSHDWLLQHSDDPFAPGWHEHRSAVGENYTQVHCPDGKLYAQVDQDGDGKKAEDGYDGVDLNRNWGVNWRVTENNGIGDFGGEEPWSEAESRAVRDFVLAHPNIQQALDLHSGKEQILFPMAFSTRRIPEYERFTEIGRSLCPDETTEVQPYHKLYVESGTAIDWLYEQKIVPFVFEIYEGRPVYKLQRDGTYIYDMCSGWAYNPATPTGYNWVVGRWVPAIRKWMAMDLQISP